MSDPGRAARETVPAAPAAPETVTLNITDNERYLVLMMALQEYAFGAREAARAERNHSNPDAAWIDGKERLGRIATDFMDSITRQVRHDDFWSLDLSEDDA
jgi:hypothetical protein